MNLEPFYSPSRFGWHFGGEWSSYTIVPGRHIGLDIASTGDVPALVGGTVVRVRLQETQLGSVVVVQGDDGLYYSYCHLSKLRLPWVGQRVERGDRLGTLARGPRTLPASDPQYPGWAWFGIHLHLVISTHPDSAYSYIPGHRTLAAFRDPDPIIRNILEEDDMFTDNDRAVLGKLYDLLTPGVQGVKFDGDVITRLKSIDDKAALSAERAAWGDIRNQSTIFLRDEQGFGPEWMRVGPTLGKGRGYDVTLEESEARRWALTDATHQFARSSFRPIKVSRDDYIAIQLQANQDAKAWRAAIKQAIETS